MDTDTLCNKFLGSILGTAIGDSVGAGFEGLQGFTEDQVHAVAERRKVLRYTDDTHMMIGVAESLIAKSGFDGEHMANRFIYNYNWEPFRGYGPGPPRIFAAIQEGESWDRASEKLYLGGSYGNGAAMRIAPVGLLYYDNPQKLKEVAYQSSHVTHAHILGKEGAALQAYAVALATTLDPTSSFDREAFLRKLGDFVVNDTYKEKLQTMEDLWNESDKIKIAAELGNGVEAFNSVPAAIFSFLTHPNSFEEAVVYAISLGGDTDTIGAMAGAISGAYLGMDSIPAEWLAKLENRLYIEPLATELWQIKTE
ncbi:MAG: ADP-ribosylglycohydrolase family protein [Chloroflexi bacterium]|nr:ADP-ribosylglycohydrolase family protein [Chloroflexota bacterium]